jgi:hypothetical protein
MQLDRRCLIGAGAPAPTEASTRTVTDVLSRSVEINWPVERVVIATRYNDEDVTAIAGVEGWKKVAGFAREPWEDWRASTCAEYATVIRNLASLPDIGTMGSEFDADKIGALNVSDGKVPEYGGQLPVQALLSADPDVILFAGSGWPAYSKGIWIGFGTDLATTRATLATYAAHPATIVSRPSKPRWSTPSNTGLPGRCAMSTPCSMSASNSTPSSLRISTRPRAWPISTKGSCRFLSAAHGLPACADLPVQVVAGERLRGT